MKNDQALFHILNLLNEAEQVARAAQYASAKDHENDGSDCDMFCSIADSLEMAISNDDGEAGLEQIISAWRKNNV